MRLSSNIGRTVGRTGGKSDTGRANGVVKFGLFCDRAGYSFYKEGY